MKKYGNDSKNIYQQINHGPALINATIKDIAIFNEKTENLDVFGGVEHDFA